MPHAPFDPTGALKFDLSSGCIFLESVSERVLVSAKHLNTLIGTLQPSALTEFGQALGADIGHRIAIRLGARDVTPEAFVEHLGGELCLAGLGKLALERWGHALIFVLDHAQLDENLTASIIDGALKESVNRETQCVRIMHEGTRSRFVVLKATTARRVRDWLSDGMSWGEMLVRLHGSEVASEP